MSPAAEVDSSTEHQPVEPLASDRGAPVRRSNTTSPFLAMAELVTNLIHIPPVLGVYIKALYDVVSKLALDLAGDRGCNTL